MNKEQEAKTVDQAKEIMTRLRNDSIATGMRSALGAIYGLIEKSNKSDSETLAEIKEFCKKGIENPKDTHE